MVNYQITIALSNFKIVPFVKCSTTTTLYMLSTFPAPGMFNFEQYKDCLLDLTEEALCLTPRSLPIYILP